MDGLLQRDDEFTQRLYIEKQCWMLQGFLVWKTFTVSISTVVSSPCGVHAVHRIPFYVMMSVFISAVAFILLLTFLILIHEWGHYKAAKLCGVVVEEFGFGLPPKIKTLFRRDGTDFTVNWIPFGGFVRLKGENAIDEKERRSKGSFSAASIPARLVILLAGVFMNLMFALILLTIGFTSGNWIPTYTSFEEMEEAATRGDIHLVMGVRIDEVMGEGNAARAGIPTGSLIHSIDGVEITRPSQVMKLQEGKVSVVYTIARFEDGTVQPETEDFRVALKDGKSGIVIVPFPLELDAPNRDIVTAFALSLRESVVRTQLTVKGLALLFSSLLRHGTVPDNVIGIVGIAQQTHVAVQTGLMQYLYLVAMISLSLAALNVLPFPALDGGRVLFVLAELISRRPINRTFELTTNAIGFCILLILIVLITFNDIIRLF